MRGHHLVPLVGPLLLLAVRAVADWVVGCPGTMSRP